MNLYNRFLGQLYQPLRSTLREILMLSELPFSREVIGVVDDILRIPFLTRHDEARMTIGEVIMEEL